MYNFCLIFIVNGEDILVEFDPLLLCAITLDDAKNFALEDSHNTGRLDSDWEVRDLDGNLILDLSKPLEDYVLESGTRFWCTLKTGAGGISYRLKEVA